VSGATDTATGGGERAAGQQPDRADGRRLRREAVVVDGMAFQFGGWCEELGRSGITAIIVTVDDFVSGYEPTRRRLRELRRVVEDDPRLALVLSIEDIHRVERESRVGIILGFQNANPVENKLEHLVEFAELGLRSMQLTYNRTNRVGSGCLAPRDDGLTRFGREVVRAMNDLGVLVDLSHCGPATAADAIALSRTPPVFTHAGAAAVTQNPRNRSDDEIRAVADAGGLIGLSAFGPFCWDPVVAARPTLRSLLRHVDHVVELVGDRHVGFGGDWPVGLSPTVHERAKRDLARDAAAVIGDYNRAVGDAVELRYPSDMPSLAHAAALTGALVEHGLATESVRRMIGGNFLRVFEAVWR
jgi:membrane dipeptidase